MFTVYHLQKSQSERVVWLCEELGLEYDLKIFPRDPQTGMAPPFIKSLTPAGSAPVLIDRPAGSDKEIVIAESSAIVDYIIHVHGGGKLAFKPGEDEYADYLTWFHFSNATLQASLGRAMMFSFIGDAVADSPMGPVLNARLAKHLKMVDDRLGVATYLAGDQLTAADIMTMCTLTTMRGMFLFFFLDSPVYERGWLLTLDRLQPGGFDAVFKHPEIPRAYQYSASVPESYGER